MPLTALIAGPYTPPPVRRGDPVICLYRDAEAVVTSWTTARIPWPRCRKAGEFGGAGLLMTGDPPLAVRTEAAAALKSWFGVGRDAVCRWRKWAGVSGTATTPGSKAAHYHVCEAGRRARRAGPADRPPRTPPVARAVVPGIDRP